MKNYLILLILFLSAPLLKAQDLNHDISLKFTGNTNLEQDSRIGLEYRNGYFENIKLKIGGDFGRSNGGIGIDNSIVFGSDSVIITRNQGIFFENYQGYLGFDFEGVDYFSFGIAAVMGYKKARFGVYDTGSRYEAATDDWVNCIECAYAYHNDPNIGDNGSLRLPSQYSALAGETKYFVFGISFRAGVYVPLSDRFEITAAYEPIFTVNKELSTTNYDDIPGDHVTNIGSFNQLLHSFSAAVRYKF